ncbi:hypothetical protein [Streptomyces sp. NPDC101234]|uniref:hypothetical protein n=1 Tax=Streptomyces sp. NPDC101234 TaxID=3366138 RepID=UPI0038177011
MSTATVRRVPLTVRETLLEGAASTATASSESTSSDSPITPPAITAPPTAVVVAMKVRRLGVVEGSPSPAEGGTAAQAWALDRHRRGLESRAP